MHLEMWNINAGACSRCPNVQMNRRPILFLCLFSHTLGAPIAQEHQLVQFAQMCSTSFYYHIVIRFFLIMTLTGNLQQCCLGFLGIGKGHFKHVCFPWLVMENLQRSWECRFGRTTSAAAWEPHEPAIPVSKLNNIMVLIQQSIQRRIKPFRLQL